MPQFYELNLRDYWNIFLKRKLIFVMSFLVIFLSIFFYTSLQIPSYQADVLLKIDIYMGIPTDLVFSTMTSRYWKSLDELSDYTQQIVSRPVLQQAAIELGMVMPGMSKRENSRLISKINSRVSAARVTTQKESNLIKLSVRGPDPQEAADLANKMFEIFKRENTKQKNQRIRNVRIFIDDTLEIVSEKLKEQEERLRELTTQGAIGSGVNIVDQIYAMEKEYTTLTSKYTESHPTVVRLRQQIDNLKLKLKALPKEEFEYGILKRDISINEKLYISLKQKLQETQIKEAEKIDNVILINPAIAPLKPYYPNKKKNYTVGIMLGLLFGVTTALVTEHLDTSIGRVDDIESFIKVGVLGIIPYCVERKRDRDKKERGLLGALIGKKSEKKDLYANTSIFEFDHHHSSIFLEAFRILAVNVQVLFGERGRIKNKVILITSCNPEEGKTVVASNLSITFAQMGYKVLLIDTDTRRSSIHKMFGLKKKEMGFTDILMGKSDFDSVIKTATDLMLGSVGADKVIDKPWLNNLNIITAGSVFPNTINLFNSDKMEESIRYYRDKYEIIIIDTSPVLAVSEPSIIIPKVDGVALVYKAGATSRLALRRAKIQIEGVKGKGALSGVVLNNVTPEIGLDTYYYYSRKYYGEREMPTKGA
ncbi:MAG: polysaccharide biosynthesis tyrosine autokinase [Candidatus Omnitrophica bacterium]|nr:polysaccharide biosynthesis tyrosine autokinase [Candidatus Omnitrophota bacterium]